MAGEPVEAVCGLPQTDTGQKPTRLPNTSLDIVVQDIGTKGKNFIAVDIDSGYWKLVSE